MAKDEKRQGKRRIFTFAVRLAVRFLIFVVMLFGLGYLVHLKTTSLLQKEMSAFAAAWTESRAESLRTAFDQELSLLAGMGTLLERESASPQAILDALNAQEPLAETGIADVTGATVAGTEPLSAASLQRNSTFQGDSISQIYPGAGIIFSVPVGQGDTVRYMLYRQYRPDAMAKKFRLPDDAAMKRFFICERSTGHVIVPYEGFRETDAFFDAARRTPMGYATANLRLQQGHTAAMPLDGIIGLEDYLICAADIPGSEDVLVGYAQKSFFTETIARIHYIILWVFGLLVLMFSVFTLYSFTAALKAEESDELRAARDEAERANEAKSAFLANMSHEIRTPINAVLGMNEMVLREAHDNAIRKYAWNIKSAGETLLSLINDILDFSKIESGKMELVEGPYQVSSMLNDIVNMIRFKAEQKGLSFHVEVDESLPDQLEGDEVRIRQIIVNLLNNAVKYTPKGSVTFAVRGEKAEDGENLTLRLLSIDTGLGIRDEDRDKLFSQFERLDVQKNRNIEGTGLGLSITLNLVRMMKGTITVDSVYGEGSTFAVSIPQRIVSPEPIGNFQERVEKFVMGEKNYRENFIAPDADILVVDDNEMNLFVVESLLKRTRIRMTRSTSGADCLEKISQNRYDIVFLDHMMPDMDGIETLQRARAMVENQCRDVPYIALTANAIAGAKDMFLEKGFTDYLSKPINSKALERMLQKYLPPEKIREPEETPATPPEEQPEVVESVPAPAEAQDLHIDKALGMQYSGDMEEMYREFLAMFCQRKGETQQKIRDARAAEKWEDFTAFVHALKSTSLTVGGVRLSEAAKALEEAGQALLDNPEAREESLAYIQSHTEETLALYDAFVEEARQRFGIEA